MLVTSPVRIKYVAFLLFVTSHFRCSSFFVQICCLQNINVLKIKSLLLFLKNISKQAESDVCFNWVRFRSPVQIFCRIRSHVLLISFNFNQLKRGRNSETLITDSAKKILVQQTKLPGVDTFKNCNQ